MFRSIEKQVESAVSGQDLYAYLVHFPDLDMIFSHTGIHTLFDVSRTIEQTLAEQWGEQHLRYTLSFKEYVVLISRPSGDATPMKEKRIDFSYKKIPLPFSASLVRLDGDDAFYKLTDTLFALSGK